VRTVEHEGMLSHPPVRQRADGEAALAGLLRIGSGLGTRVARTPDERVDGLLRAVMYSLALLLLVVSLGALL